MEVTSLQEHKAEGLPLFVSASSCHITTAYKEFFFFLFLKEKRKEIVSGHDVLSLLGERLSKPKEILKDSSPYRQNLTADTARFDILVQL